MKLRSIFLTLISMGILSACGTSEEKQIEVLVTRGYIETRNGEQSLKFQGDNPGGINKMDNLQPRVEGYDLDGGFYITPQVTEPVVTFELNSNAQGQSESSEAQSLSIHHIYYYYFFSPDQETSIPVYNDVTILSPEYDQYAYSDIYTGDKLNIILDESYNLESSYATTLDSSATTDFPFYHSDPDDPLKMSVSLIYTNNPSGTDIYFTENGEVAEAGYSFFVSPCDVIDLSSKDLSEFSHQMAITEFSFAAADNPDLSSDITGTLDETTITLMLPHGTDEEVLTDLVATFTTTGAEISVDGVTQTSGTTANDFSQNLIYTVTAADDGSTTDYEIIVYIDYSAGDSKAYTIDTASLNMKYFPEGTVTTGANDSEQESIGINDVFWIGETEVTYELWNIVYTWATGNGYTFANTGIPGHDGTAGTETDSQEPVTTVNWRDAIVFCNAITEYYNTHNSGSLTYAYTSDESYNTPIKDSSDGSYGASINNTDGSFDAPFVNPDATGFRLPTELEWESAARYINGEDWTPGNYASGASAATTDTGATSAVAVFQFNSGGSTAVVKSLGASGANALGCYDMSGNVKEWTFDWDSYYVTDRTLHGGSWDSENGITFDTLMIAFSDELAAYNENNMVGLRLCKSVY